VLGHVVKANKVHVLTRVVESWLVRLVGSFPVKIYERDLIKPV
jgi:hypothetical protein